MSNILTKPYTDKDYADFAVMANSNGQRTEQDDNAVYALYDYEKLQNGQIINISDTDDYKAQINTQTNDIRKTEIQEQINSLDLKRIRALAEGGTMPDGTTYLEYYTNQITAFRAELNNL